MSDIPTHLGLILDGNRRWAKSQGLATFEGHERGAEVLQEIALLAFKKGVKFVSAFIFSTENWARAETEVNFLMKLVADAPNKYLETYHEAGIKILVAGQRDRLSKEVLAAIERAEERTRDNKNGILVLCFNYGGQLEIADAVNKLIKQGKTIVSPEDIADALYAPELPQADLIVRTSGEQRLSGFMLWRAAYAELKFVDKNWPDFTEADLNEVLEDYSNRQRRFGK